jgi:hypothetical protein
MPLPKDWTPSSWRQAELIVQDVAYSAEKTALDLPRATAKLQHLPPLVTAVEVCPPAACCHVPAQYSVARLD